MVLPLSKVEGHRRLVLDLYRTVIRNALHVPIPIKDKTQLVVKIRKRFRTQSLNSNGIQIKSNVIDGNHLNDLIVDCYKEKTLNIELGKFINPNFYYSTPSTFKNDNIKTEKRINKNNNNYKTQLTPNKIYLKTLELRPYKTKLDSKYVNEILPSIISFNQQMAYLKKLRVKLQKNSSGAKLRKINGTSNNIFIINTPWNGDLKTESGRWISQIRKEYDESITDFNLLNSQREKYQRWSEWESKWDSLIFKDEFNKIKGKKELDDNNWFWCFKESDSIIKKRIDKVNNKVNIFNIKQGIILKDLKPNFDLNHLKSRKNIERLFELIDELQIGAFSDISLKLNLGKLIEEHQFRNKYKF